MNRHTRGLWDPGTFKAIALKRPIIPAGVPCPIVQSKDGFIICFVNTFAGSDGGQQDLANARLIATAPEMLAMLRRLEFINGRRTDDDCQICGGVLHHKPGCALAALISKAEGEAPC